MLKNLILFVSIITAPLVTSAVESAPQFTEHITALTEGPTESPVKLKKNGSITTTASFKPPVEILIDAKTDSTNLRLSYAADQMIFNWERDRNQLRVDGGPANGQHKSGAGLIPTNKYVTIRWIVTPTGQFVYVDGQLRFEHSGDYSLLDKPIRIFSVAGSELTVKSIKVRWVPPDTK